MKKKLTSVLVLCAMAFTLALPVSAAQPAAIGIQPRAQECGKCGRMTLNTVKVGDGETGPTIRKCKHGYVYGQDKVFAKYITYKYKCGHCSYISSPFNVSAGERFECHGYN